MPYLAGSCAPDLPPPPPGGAATAVGLGPCRFLLQGPPGGPPGVGAARAGELLCAVEGLAAGAVGETAARRVLAAYRRAGEEALIGLQGLFRLALWDGRRERVYLAVDPSGLRPLYYAAAPCVFAPTPALVGGGTVDEAGAADFLLFGFAAGERTLRRGVRPVPPGGLVRLSAGRAEVVARRPLRFARAAPVRHGADRLAQALLLAVESLTRGVDVVDLPLSGGLDSRALAAALHRLGRPFRTWTLGDATAADLALARTVARRLGVPHRALPVDDEAVLSWLRRGPRLTDGLLPAFDAHILHLLGHLPPDARLVLDGASPLDGFFFRAHLWLARLRPPLPGPALLRRVAAAPLFDARGRLGRPELFRPAFRERLTERLRALLERWGRDPGGEGRPLLDVHQEQFLQLRVPAYTALGGLLVESRTAAVHPLFHPAVLAVVLAAPPTLRTAEKPLLAAAIRRLAPELDGIPYERTGLPPHAGALRQLWGHLRRRLRRGRAAGGQAVDYAGRTRRSALLRRHLLLNLLAPGNPLHAWVEADALRRLLDGHLAGRRDETALLGTLLTLSTWLQEVPPGVRGPDAEAAAVRAWP